MLNWRPLGKINKYKNKNGGPNLTQKERKKTKKIDSLEGQIYF